MLDLSSKKLRRMTQIIFVFFLVLAFRAWHLEVVQRDEKLRQSMLPKRRVIVQKADRGVLLDRFHIPLATNRICYNATIYYNQIAQVPVRGWVSGPNGKKVRSYPRKEYVHKLSLQLAETLHLDVQRVEDLILSKASLFPHVPFLLKGGLTENEHYQLALLEKDWPCLHAEIASERFYPRGKAGSGIIGSMGSISQKKYLAIAEEIRTLQQVVDETHQGLEPEFPSPSDTVETLELRLQQLKEKAYTLQDLVGKSGAEAQFESSLRGLYGKQFFEVDQKGKILAEMEGGKPAVAGGTHQLSISIELQEFAEALLAQDEAAREKRSLGLDPETHQKKTLKQPWIKGGAIVALDPRTGEILALASAPRFDPNDFIPSQDPAVAADKRQRLCRWLENERAIAAIWDGKQPLRRERYSPSKGFFEENAPLTWDLFLSLVLPDEGPLKAVFAHIPDVKTAVKLQEGALPEMLSSLESNVDRLFVVDLCRLVVHAPAFSDTASKVLGKLSLNQYRALNQAVCRLEERLKAEKRKLFHATEFAQWRSEHAKDCVNGRRPYVDLLDQKERELFNTSWEESRLDLLASAILDDPECSMLAQPNLEETKAVLHTFRSYNDLKLPLLSKYRAIEGTQKQLAAAFYPQEGFGYSRSYAFQTSGPQGSVFKLVSAYAGLMATKGVNPFTMIDEWKGAQAVGTTMAGALYPRMYKGGRLPRSASAHVGQIDIVGAIERSSNPYFSLIAGDVLRQPEDLNTAARRFGFGEKTGIELPGETSGGLPQDLAQNRTGLYSMAIGQHTLLTTPLQTAIMVATIANGGHVLKPHILKQANPQILRTIELPNGIRNQLLEGMDRVIWSEKGNCRPETIRHLQQNPEWKKRFLALEHQVVGKSGTAEVLYNLSMNPSSTAAMYKHIWFGAVDFGEDGGRNDPDLVVVVFLRFGDAGREAAPLAAEVINKWRELKRRHNM